MMKRSLGPRSISEENKEKARQRLIEWMDVVDLGYATPCHISRRTTNGKGYATLKIERRGWYAHRLSYYLFKGELTEDLVVDHLCRNRACINPDHLELVSQKVNLLRGVGPTATRSQQVECINGHELAGSNVYTRPNGTRLCRRCDADRARVYRARKTRARLGLTAG